ncbi:class F sortase [Rossellomorea vietnamensis]|uniref:Class F sortase n=1 Tax=Rossellomorea vietnamensis TaxID=218284 RepID=A0A5D4MHI1_9BACI|nr:class F sortase [Rossellomorea vietnamensis]TYS01102.1 class F sortase [Rossellomorea vietnamensis]
MKKFILMLMALLAGCSAEEPQPVNPTETASYRENQKAPTTLVSNEKPASVSTEPTLETTGIKPASLSIPKLEIDAPIKEFGLDSEGSMEVPENGVDVAWFEPGIQPGQKGNAVLAGHVDDEKQPAVFFRLKELVPGDKIFLQDETGKTLTFMVREKEAYQKDDAPLRKVFGPGEKRMLNLITCTGYFDRDIHNYVERLVIFTELVEVS